MREQILPGARLAEEEDGRVIGCGQSLEAGRAVEELAHRAHGRALAE